MSDIRALSNRVIVREIHADNISQCGIIIDPDKDLTRKGAVVTVGEGVQLADGTLRPLAVVVGDIVYFAPHVGNEIVFDGHDSDQLLVIREEDILAVGGRL